MGRRSHTVRVMGGAIAVLVAALIPSGAPASATAAASTTGQPPGSPLLLPLGATTGGLAGLVHPLDGTGIGPVNPGNVSEYPGASVPLGMVQFSPDTAPSRQHTPGSGYDYQDSTISGFSLTHLSGDGCAIYGDIPILPAVGSVPADPGQALQPFSHHDEQASAGRYAVTLGQGSTAIRATLTATTRSALGTFTFPARSRTAGAPNNQGDDLLFKVSDSANGSTASQVRVASPDELTGSVTSGDFCGIPGSYTLYFAAQFSQRFSAHGTWQNATAGPAGHCSGTSKVTCGAWVSFPQSHAATTIDVKVGVSFVSVAGAENNLTTEDRGWDFSRVAGAATAEWNGLLGRIGVSGGSTADRRTFYTALYHSLLFPSVFSDDDGRYIGFDHRVHTLAKGEVQYANFSEGDIYRSEVPLLATLLPGPTSQMVQSLLRDGAQTKGGYLPKWVIADNDAGQWDGDSVDPIIADAYAYGARQFDVRAALGAMVHGATVPEAGFIVERPNLAQYEAQGWVPQLTIDVTSYPYTDGGSETLEYALDDFAIEQVALDVGDKSVATTFARAAGIGRTSSIRPRATSLPARPPGPSRPAPPSSRRISSISSRASPNKASRRGTPSSTPGPCRRTWPASSPGWVATRPRWPSSTSTSPSSMPPASRPYRAGPATSRANGCPTSTTTPGSLGSAPKESCAAS